MQSSSQDDREGKRTGSAVGQQLQRSPSAAKSAFGPVTPEDAALIGRNVRIENSVALRATPAKDNAADASFARARVGVGAPISTGLLGLDGLFGLRGWQVIYIAEAIPTVGMGRRMLMAFTAEGYHEARRHLSARFHQRSDHG
jgi:hypothetical protein